MNPSSPENKNDSWRLEDLLTSSNDGTESAGSTRPSCEPASPVSESPAPVEESGQAIQLSFSDCETSATTSKGLLAISSDQLELAVAPTGKRCYGCRRLLPIEVFARMRYKAKPGVEFRNPRCNKCRSTREKGTPNVVARRKLYEEARAKPCTDCGREYPLVCMELDHVRGDKAFCIGASHMHVRTHVLIEEIAKCDPVCANCHKLRTAARIADGTVKKKSGRPPKFLAEVGSTLSETAPGPRSLWTKYRKLS